MKLSKRNEGARGTSGEPSCETERAIARFEGMVKKMGFHLEDDHAEGKFLAFTGVSRGTKNHQAAILGNECGRREGKKCGHCGRMGHAENEGFVKKYGITTRKPGVTCHFCKREGFLEGDCYALKNHVQREGKESKQGLNT